MPDHDELNRRRQQREAMRKKRLAEQRRLKRKLIFAALALVVCGAAVILLSRSGGQVGDTGEESSAATQAVTQATAAPTEATKSKRNSSTVIHIRAAGDLNVTDDVILAGAGSGGYDFTQCFQGVAGVLSDADMTLLNFEGNLCGEPYGSSTTSAPQQLAQALQAAGVDLVQTANSCSVNNGLMGMTSTMNSLRSAGIEPVGTFSSPEEFKKTKGYTICQIQGIKVAVVAFTKGVGSMGLPTGSEDCVNLLYTDYATTYQEVDKDAIRSVLKAVAAEKPDITIALLHWGSEYNDTISSSQTSIASLMTSMGVDVIIGSHSHRLQKVEFDKTNGTLIAYSLGDFFGSAKEAGSNYSVILDVEITRDADAGTTKVTNFSYIPIYTLKESETCDNQRRVVTIEEAMTAYEQNYVDKVTADAYTSMESSLKRIEERILGDDA